MTYIYCNNKKCGKHQESLLDVDTNKVICSECGNPIDNITEFFKRHLLLSKQIVKSATQKQAFVVKCKKCNKDGQPVLAKVNNKNELVCRHCKEAFGNDISYAFKVAITEHLLSNMNK